MAAATAGGQGTLSPAGTGKVYEAVGSRIRLVTTGAQTGGAFAGMEVEFPAGGSELPPHTHQTYGEAFYVLSGEVRCQVGDRTESARVGPFGFAPTGVVHGFANTGASPASVLILQAPAPDLEGFLEAMSQLPAGPPDMQRLGAIFERFDLHPAGPPPTPR